MSKTGNRLYVHLPAHLDAAEYRVRWEAGIEPDESPYGFHLARDLGWSVRFSTRRPAAQNLAGRVIERLNRFSGSVDLLHVWHNRRTLRQADVVWSMLEQDALAVSVLMLLRVVPRTPLISGTVWMVNGWRGYGVVTRMIIRGLLRFWAVLTVHTELCLKVARREFRSVETRLLRFGISTEAFPLISPRLRTSERTIIFAMGNDPTRDWDVLLRAFGNDERFELHVVCRWFNDAEAEPYDNVKIIRDPDMRMMRELYDSADYAAVPMHPNIYSGITVALEAAALGVPVLGTRTGGLATYFTEDELLLAEPGDDRGLREAVLAQTVEDRRAMAERAQHRFRKDDYSTVGMIRRYDALTREVLATGC